MNIQKHLEISDILIHSIEIPGDTSQAGYNIGDLFNMPYLSGQWEISPPGLRERIAAMSEPYPGSILERFHQIHPSDAPLPSIPHLVKAVREFTLAHEDQLKEIRPIVQDPKCLCVHVRSGDQRVSADFIDTVATLSTCFDVVILLSGIHRDQVWADHTSKRQNFWSDINEILSRNTNIYICQEEPDIHLSIMMLASNLLVHRAGFSALGAIVATGRLFRTKHFYHADHANWIEAVDKELILLSPGSTP